MNSIDTIIEYLEDPKIHDYRKEWLIYSTNDEYNILFEVFTFGGIESIEKLFSIYGKDVLDRPMIIIKLLKLSIIKMSSEQRCITYEDIMSLINHYRNNQNFDSMIIDEKMIENIFIELNDYIDFEIDSVSKRILIINCKKCREVYCFEKPLEIIDEKDITNTKNIIQDLEAWKNKLSDIVLNYSNK